MERINEIITKYFYPENSFAAFLELIFPMKTPGSPTSHCMQKPDAFLIGSPVAWSHLMRATG